MFAHGKARDGSTLIFFRGSLYDTTRCPMESYVLAATYVIDTALCQARPRKEKINQVGFTKYYSGSRFPPPSEKLTVVVHTAAVPGAPNCAPDMAFIKTFINVTTPQPLPPPFPSNFRSLLSFRCTHPG
jgi:hypothetical protein